MAAAVPAKRWRDESELHIAVQSQLWYVRAPEWLVALDQSRKRLSDHVIHVPNGGGRSKREAGRFKAMGVRAAVPDQVTRVPRGRYHGAAFELKQPGNYPTKDQRAELEYLRAIGYVAAWGDTLEAAMSFWLTYFLAGMPMVEELAKCELRPRFTGEGFLQMWRWG